MTLLRTTARALSWCHVTSVPGRFTGTSVRKLCLWYCTVGVHVTTLSLRSTLTNQAHRARHAPLKERLTHAQRVHNFSLRVRVLQAPSVNVLNVLNVRRCDRCTRTPRRLRTRNRSSPLRCFPPWCPARALLHLQREHTCVSRISLMTVGCFRSRAPPTTLPPSCPLPRACPILRPRARLLTLRLR